MKYRIIILLLLFLIANAGFAQDTTGTTKLPRFNPQQHFWSRKRIELRAGVGLQKSFYTELGLAYHKCNYSDVGFGSNTFYTAVEYTPGPNIYALKAGYELNVMLVAFALETKYQTNFTHKDFVVTPKIGIGLFGDMLLYYGYNISTNRRPFTNIGRHHVSLIGNIGKGFLKY